MIADTSQDAKRTRPPGQAVERNDLKTLFSSLADDASRWIRQETELAKAELTRKAQELTRQVGTLAASLVAIAVGAALLLFAAAAGVSILYQGLGLSVMASASLGLLTVGAVIVSSGLILFFRSKEKISASNLKPQRTAESLIETKNWAQSKIQ